MSARYKRGARDAGFAKSQTTPASSVTNTPPVENRNQKKLAPVNAVSVWADGPSVRAAFPHAHPIVVRADLSIPACHVLRAWRAIWASAVEKRSAYRSRLAFPPILVFPRIPTFPRILADEAFHSIEVFRSLLADPPRQLFPVVPPVSPFLPLPSL